MSATLFDSGFRVLSHLVMWPARVAAARRTLRSVATMSDYELRDIGLTRQDVRDAACLGVAEDPGALFTRRVAEKRGAISNEIPVPMRNRPSPERRSRTGWEVRPVNLYDLLGVPDRS